MMLIGYKEFIQLNDMDVVMDYDHEFANRVEFAFGDTTREFLEITLIRDDRKGKRIQDSFMVGKDEVNALREFLGKFQKYARDFD